MRQQLLVMAFLLGAGIDASAQEFTGGIYGRSRVDVDALRARMQRDGIMFYAISIRGREGTDTGQLRALARATGGWSFELKPVMKTFASARATF